MQNIFITVMKFSYIPFDNNIVKFGIKKIQYILPSLLTDILLVLLSWLSDLIGSFFCSKSNFKS